MELAVCPEKNRGTSMLVARLQSPNAFLRMSLFCLLGLLMAPGCQKGSAPEEGGPAKQPSSKVNSGSTRAPVSVSPGERWIEHTRIGEGVFGQFVVRVEGCPLLFTRQVFGKGPDDRTQISSAWNELQTIFRLAEASSDHIVRLNIVAADDKALAAAMGFLAEAFHRGTEPSMTYVISPLPVEGARVGLDAVVVPYREFDSVTRWETKGEAEIHHTEASVTPTGGLVFFSGQPDKSPLPQGAANSLKALLAAAQELGVKPADVLQLRIFLQPISAAPQVMEEVEKVFGKDNTPPVVFTEWMASAPVEIEMVARWPQEERDDQEVLKFYNPAGVKPSPVFSRVTVVASSRVLFFPTVLPGEVTGAEQQAADVFQRLETLLDNQGSNWKHVAKATYFVSDKEASSALDSIRPKYLDPQRPPAASKVTVHAIGQPGRTLSVDLIAVPRVARATEKEGTQP